MVVMEEDMQRVGMSEENPRDRVKWRLKVYCDEPTREQTQGVLPVFSDLFLCEMLNFLCCFLR